MKRFTTAALAVALGLFSSAALVGCGEDAEQKLEVTQEGPGGERTETITKETDVSGENPPPPTGIGAPTEK